MSFLMDLVGSDQPTGDSLLDRNYYSNSDGIELRDIGTNGLVVEEMTGPRLHKDRRGRLMAIGGSLVLVVMILGSMSSIAHRNESRPKYAPNPTLQTAMNSGNPVAGKPLFRKPNATETALLRFAIVAN